MYMCRRNLYTASKTLSLKIWFCISTLDTVFWGLQVTCNNIIVNPIVLHLHVGQWALFNTFK